MSVEPKIVAAISGAINLYLQMEQEVLAASKTEEPEHEAMIEAKALRRAQLPSLWALSGRQSAMEMRRMWQMRLVR